MSIFAYLEPRKPQLMMKQGTPSWDGTYSTDAMGIRWSGPVVQGYLSVHDALDQTKHQIYLKNPPARRPIW